MERDDIEWHGDSGFFRGHPDVWIYGGDGAQGIVRNWGAWNWSDLKRTTARPTRRFWTGTSAGARDRGAAGVPGECTPAGRRIAPEWRACMRRRFRGRWLRHRGRPPVPPAAGDMQHLRPPHRQALRGLRLLDQRQGPRTRVPLPHRPLAVERGNVEHGGNLRQRVR